MDIREPDIFEHNIVLVGDFNVQIFQPLWFSTEDLIREKEATNAQVEIVHRDIVSFSLEWLKFRATPYRVLFSTSQASCLKVLRDLAVGTFQKLSHSRIRMLGLNYNTDTPMPTDWTWEEFQKTLRGDGVLSSFESGVIQSISLENKRTYNDLEGAHIIKIKPSRLIERGVSVSTNDYYVLRQDEPVSARIAVATIEEQWESAFTESEEYRKLVVGSDD